MLSSFRRCQNLKMSTPTHTCWLVWSQLFSFVLPAVLRFVMYIMCLKKLRCRREVAMETKSEEEQK